MTGWGTSWNKPISWDDINHIKPAKPTLTINEDGPLEAREYIIEPTKNIFIGIDLGIDDRTSYTDNKVRSNKVPTHDPYTNPNAQLYYSCDCGNILDPGTKRFAELNNHAMNAGWKIRWGCQYYVPFCPKCVKEKGIE